MHIHPIVSLLALVVLLPLLACEPTTGDETAPSPPTDYDAPFRTDAQLTAELETRCHSARDAGRPLLLEFSAAWCSDCRKLHAMKQDALLAEELEEWETVVVNVGRFDRHRPLLAALGVESIAHWEVLAPTRCDTPIGTWPSLARRTLEVSSGDARDLTPGDLADWLSRLRAAYQS